MSGLERDPGAPGAGPRSGPAAFGSSRSRVRESVAHATQRIQEIIDAAERVAEEIQRDAEAEADRYLAERRRQANRLTAEQAEQLEHTLAGLRDHLSRIEAEGAALLAQLERAVARLRAPDPGAGEEREVRRSGDLREAALIRATQMAVSGSERSEIEAVLREELGVDEPASLVDQVLRD
jgi:cell division septum initiation protein DivIVA